MGVLENTPLEEDATRLQFTKEFESADCDALMISEVYLLLSHRKEQNELKDDIDEMNEKFLLTMDYTQRFAKFKKRELVRAVRGLFIGRTNLHKFEVVQLTNLCPETADEAKSLIPSLSEKIGDAELEDLLKDLNSKKALQ